MFRLSTIRRRLLLGAGSLLVLSGLSLMVVHTGVVRRFALVQLQIRLGNAVGLVIDAKELDYNLFSSRFELKDITLKGIGLADMPAPVRAQRIQLVLPIWRLIRGSFDTARIRIDGLSVHWYTARGGKSNWPSISGPGGGASAGGPAVLVTSGDLYLHDDRNGFLLQLPLRQLSGAWDAVSSKYGIVCEGGAGSLQWKDSSLPLEGIQLKSALSSGRLSLESLRLVSRRSEIQVSGSLSGSPARIAASADLNVELHDFSQARGRVRAHLSAAGLLDAVQLNAALRGNSLVVGGTVIRRPVAEASIDLGSGEVRVKGLSAQVLGGNLSANGRLWIGAGRKRGELAASLIGLELREVAGLFGATDIRPGRTSVTVRASWPGLDWRLAELSGAAWSQSSNLTFAATGRPDSIRGSFHSTLGVGATLGGKIGFGLADHALTGVVHGTVESIARVGSAASLNLPAIDGAARWSAILGGTTALPSASLQLDLNGLSTGRWTGGDLHVQASFAADRIAIERAQLTWGGQQIEAKGEIGGISADAPLRMDGTIKSPSLAGVTPSIEAEVSGGFRLAGTIASPVAETMLQTGPLTAWGERFSRASLDARWQEGELTLTDLAVDQDQESGAPGHFEASGCLDPATGRFEIAAAGRDLRLKSVVLPGGRPLNGSFQIETHGQGTLSDPAFNLQLDASDVKVGEIAVGELHAKVEAAGHRATALLAAPALHVQVASTIAMQGAWPFELTLDAKETRIPETSFDAALHANGTMAPLQLERAAAAIENFRLVTQGREILGDGPIDLSYADGRVRVGKLGLKSGDSALRLSGELPLRDGGPAGSLSLEGKVDLAPLSQSLVIGVADVSATVAGSIETWQPSGSVTIHDGRFQWQPIPFPIENISAKLNLQDGVIRLEGISAKAGTGTLRVDGSLPLRFLSDALPAPSVDAAQPARLAAQLDKLELAAGRGEAAVTATVGGKLEGEASALSLAAMRGTVEFSELDAIAKNAHLEQNGPTRITIADSVVRLEHLDLGGAGASVRATGTIGLTKGFPLQLEAAGQTNIAFLSVLAAPLEAAGTVKLDVRVGGTLSVPQTTGFVKLEQGSMVLPNPRLQAANVKLAADLDGDHITVKELSGNLNGGAFTGGGDLKVGAEGLRDVNLFLKGEDTFTEYPVFVKTTSSLDVKFVSDQNRLVLRGQIEVQDGYYDSPIDIFSRSDKALDTGPAGPPDAASNPVALDLKIVTRRPVEMDNNLGRVSATADLRLAGTVKKVGLLGALELEPDGKLYFGDRTYYIERGTVRFLDESRVTPELNIQAYTRTGDYTIRLGLTGKLDELTTTFTSDPPLSRDDVIAVLLTGKTVAENRGVDLRALEATSLATGAMNTALSSQAHRTFGVSRVSIQPGAVAAESNHPGTRITITQDFTSSLRLLYSMNLSDSNDQIWVGEYDLSRRFTTRMVKQSDNTYRGEFRHDVRFGSSSSAAGTAAIRTPDRKISDVRFTGAGSFTPEALAKVFKVKPGQKYKAIKVRKGSERLSRFLMKKGYLESRVHLDREDAGATVDLTVRIDLGATVELAYHGADLPKRQKSRLRNVWHAGISDQQRPKAAKEAILGYFAQKGFHQAQADVQIAKDGGRKTVRFDLQPGIRYRGVKIAVEGADREHKRQILSMVHDRPMKLAVYRDPKRAAEAITRYYQQRGYLAATVTPPVQELDPQGRTGRFVISVVEGPVFHVGDLQFSGNQALTAADLRTGVPLESGAVFEPARLDPTVAALKQKYGKLGYREAKIEYAIARNDDLASVDVSFTVVENKQTSIGSVVVEGNRRTSVKFARGRLRVAEGGVANTELIKDSVKNLSQTGAYTSADIQVRPPAESGAGDKPIQVADLVVAVSEPKPFRLLYGGLYDSGNGPGFIADFQILNSLGAGRTLGLRTRVDSETDEARLYLTRPFFRQQHLSTTLATYFTRQTEYHQTKPTEKLGVSIQQDLQLRSKWLLSYGYRYEIQHDFVPDPAAPNIPLSVVAVAPLTLTLSRDARDSFLDATRGSFISHGFELAPRFLGSDYPYVRYYVQYFKYFPLTRPRPVPFGQKEQRSRLVFATGSRLGLQKGFDATGAVLTDRFYAGGGTTIRGFRQDELGPRLANGEPAGGNAVLVLNEELRYPLVWIFDAVTFVDIGNVYPRVSDFRLSQLRTAGGFGLRIRNPFVVLRFDYGFKLGRHPGETLGAFFFSIGQAF